MRQDGEISKEERSERQNEREDGNIHRWMDTKREREPMIRLSPVSWPLIRDMCHHQCSDKLINKAATGLAIKHTPGATLPFHFYKHTHTIQILHIYYITNTIQQLTGMNLLFSVCMIHEFTSWQVLQIVTGQNNSKLLILLSL